MSRLNLKFHPVGKKKKKKKKREREREVVLLHGNESCIRVILGT